MIINNIHTYTRQKKNKYLARLLRCLEIYIWCLLIRNQEKKAWSARLSKDQTKQNCILTIFSMKIISYFLHYLYVEYNDNNVLYIYSMVTDYIRHKSQIVEWYHEIVYLFRVCVGLIWPTDGYYCFLLCTMR